MAKQLNINMRFNSDASRAKKDIQELQQSLTQLVRDTKIGIDNSEIKEAVSQTAQLQAHLTKALNTKTGNLDFSKLNQQIKQSGTNLEAYGDSLLKLGPQGQQAFMKLTQAIVQSEIPLRRTNGLVKEFATTLANTARWQLSSSVLHGFMGALQTAYGYAQDLNESLNNIRIVTGNSTDQMARFAKEANAAAKALSATTTEYTNASLIYFQQGLSEADVKKRADVTIKLANVSRQSAEQVSDQLTSIWNNFYDGSKSLEHYADVLTALGAATASSTEEIAGGLEKFAAVADTIGLSYEYAAAALATITSNTRESEEVVGTALKTIFARIQGLQLGETLDDGTTVNKYSEALAKVGISIFDANGNLKNMDSLLDEMGNKWNDINKAQQVALAQTVAGTRQYNQLIALMDNWNAGDSDSFKANLATAQQSSGALQEQADIYAESWEAASERVRAAAEGIYEKLLNDDAFIDLLNGIEKILGFVDRLIQSMGGLRGVVMSLGLVLTKVFSDKLTSSLNNMAYNVKMMLPGAEGREKKERQTIIQNAANKMAKMHGEGEGDPAFGVASKVYEKQLSAQSEMMKNAEKLSDIEQTQVQALMEQLKLRGELAIEGAKEVEAAKEKRSDAAALLYQRGAEKADQNPKGHYNTKLMTAEMTKIKTGIAAEDELKNLFASGKKIEAQEVSNILKSINQKDKDGNALYNIVNDKDIGRVERLTKSLSQLDQSSEEYQNTLASIEGVFAQVNGRIEEHASIIIGADLKEVKNYSAAVREVASAEKQQAEASAEVDKMSEQITEDINNASGARKTWADDFMSFANAAMAATGAISMLTGIVDTLQDPDLSGWEKFTATLTTMSMLIPTLITLWSSFKKVLESETAAQVKNLMVKLKQIVADKQLAKAKQHYDKLSDSKKQEFRDQAHLDIMKKDDLKYDPDAKTYTSQSKKQFKYDRETGQWSSENLTYSEEEFNKLKEQRAAKQANRKKYKDKDAFFDTLDKDKQIELDKKAGRSLDDKFKFTSDENGNIFDKKGKQWSKDDYNKAKKLKANKLAVKDAKATKLKGVGSSLKSGGKAAMGKVGSAASAAAPYLLIAAGIAVAAGAIAWGKAQFSKYSKAAENAAKSAESAANAFQQASQAYQNFKSNMSNLKEAKDGMKGLVKGTLEYKEAVMKANEAALALIESHEGLAYTVDSDGLIQIKDEDLQAAQAQKMQNMQKAQNAKLITAQQAKEAQTKSDMVDLARSDIKSTSGFWANAGNIAAATGAGAGAGALIGTGVGTLVPVIGNAIGAAAGAIIGGVAGLTTGIVGAAKSGSASGKEQSAIEDLGKAFVDDSAKIKAMSNEEFKNFLRGEKMGIKDEALINSLAQNREQVEKLAQQIADNTNASYALNKQLVANTLSNNATVQNSKYKDEIIATTAKFADQDKANALQRLEDSGFGTKGISKGTKVNDEAKDVFAQYAKAAGIEGAKLTNTTGNDKNRKFIYTDKDGKEQEVTLDAMREVVAQDMAMNGNVEAEKEALKNKKWGTKNISKASDKNDADAKEVWNEFAKAQGLTGEAAELGDVTGNDKNRKFVGADGKEYTLDQMMDAVAKYNAGESAAARASTIAKIYGGINDKSKMAELSAAVNNDYSKLSAAQMKKGFVAKTASEIGIASDAEAQALGYDNIAALDAALKASADQAQATWKKTLDVHSSGVKTAMSAMADVADASFGTLQSYGNMLENLDSTYVESFSSQMGQLVSKNKEHADTILNLAANIDWSQGASALDQLNGQLYDMGINVADATNSKVWNELQTTINSMSFSVVNQNLDTLREKLKTISEVAKNIKMGDVISDEQYEKLTSVNGSLKKDFVMTADGYMYVGDKDLSSTAMDTTKAQLESAKANNAKAESAYKEMQGLANVNWTGIIDGTASDADLAAATAQMADNGNILSALGKNANQVNNWKTILTDTTGAYSAEQKTAARDALTKMISDANSLQNNYEAGLYNDRKAEELAASTMGLSELDDAASKGILTKEVADKFKKALTKKMNADKDVYRVVNEELEEISDNLSLIDKKKSKAFGKEHLDLIKQETEELKKQIAAEEKKIAAAKTKLATYDKDTGKLNGGLQYDLKNDYGFEFDSKTGEIKNYDNLYNLSPDLWNDAKAAAEEYNKTLDIINNEESVKLDLELSLREQMLETYDAASSALDKYNQQFEHHANTLDQYKNLLGLMGKENDFTTMATVLEAQSEVANDQYEASKKTYQMFNDDAKKWKTLMEETTDEDLLAVYTKNWEDATAKAREAQETMLSDLQTWAEQEKAILENTIASLGHSLEQTLTGGSTFDELSTQMERAQSLQENYLTTTNKIYETRKMMNTAQQAIDASSNEVAKAKLKEFITSTKQLQEQGKLSQYELDLQQAKYDLLVAEIALEEAQNAKNTVRLQRDASGNFGYVYTADSGAVNEAQQQVYDAQNALYNKGLEGANDYSQKYQTTMQEMYDTFSEIQKQYMEGSYGSEAEYNTAMEEAKSYYYAKLAEYSSHYTTALSVDSAIASEAWGASFDDMMNSTSSWQSSVDTYITNAKTAFADWNTTIATVAAESGLNAKDMVANIGAVSQASESLLDSLIGDDGKGGLIAKLTAGFAEAAKAIQDAAKSLFGLDVTVTSSGGTTTTDTSAGDVTSMDTGGYTGEWGPEGKMAVLHEKELVLNANDTENFLSGMQLISNILATIDSYALNQQVSGMLNSPNYAANNAGTLEQNVKIEATFPSVTDHNEIEEAFNNLVNKASQYANRK